MSINKPPDLPNHLEARASEYGWARLQVAASGADELKRIQILSDLADWCRRSGCTYEGTDTKAGAGIDFSDGLGAPLPRTTSRDKTPGLRNKSKKLSAPPLWKRLSGRFNLKNNFVL